MAKTPKNQGEVNPVLAEMIRGDLVESFCRGAYVLVDREEEIIDAQGDINRIIYPRSSLKPLQALSILTSKAEQKYRLSPRILALGCSSHNAEVEHVEQAQRWMNRLDIKETMLECGESYPFDDSTAHRCLREGVQRRRIFHMCSGKHLGFLSVALAKGYDPKGYTHEDHPVQIYSRDIMSIILNDDLHKSPRAIDGCQAPVVGMSLRTLALGFARMSSPPPFLEEACDSLIQAMSHYPYFLAGTGRFCTEISSLSEGKVLCKMGAEGVFSALIPSRGWGLALKIDDGHMRGAEVALAKVLHKNRLIDGNPSFIRPPLLNSNRNLVGWWQ